LVKRFRCPICKKYFVRQKGEKDFFPFCSRECKLVDLGAWLGEEYRISEPLENAGFESIRWDEDGTDSHEGSGGGA